MKQLRRTATTEMVVTLAVSSAVCFVLYGYLLHRMGQTAFSYLPSNLLLAWIPLGFSIWLTKLLRHKLWSSWPALAVTALWFVFLPNSFYIITDLIHLADVLPDYIVGSTVVFFAFALTGMFIGYASVVMVHRQLLQRLSRLQAWGCIAATLAACSLAIYVGRDLRWNSWDVVFSPAGLLFDLTERLLHPSEYGTIIAVAGSFFVLLAGMYMVLLRLAKLLNKSSVL